MWRNRDFLKLWAGQTISEIGSRITREGVPLTAVLALHAQPIQMGWMAALTTGATLVFGLFAGVWVDRLRRRPIMIAADLSRAALLATIPLAAYWRILSMGQLYVVIALAGICAVFFDVAYQSYLPGLVRRENLLEGNSKLAMSNAAAEIAGPPLTGVLVQLITAPAAILIDAISFLVSAVSVSAIGAAEPAPVRLESRSHPLTEASAGLAFVFRQPALRSIACWYITAYLFYGLINPLYVLYVIRDLRLGPALLGGAVAVGGAGNMLGSALAPAVRKRFGFGRTFIGAAVAIGLALEFLPLARGTVVVALGCLLAQQLFGDMAHATYHISELTLRQSLAPDHMLGRVNAAMRMMSLGMIPVGSILGGLLASAIGVRATLAVAATGILLASGWLIFSPLRKMHSSELPVTL